MKSVNLIPGPRRDATRRRKHRGACAAACGAYGVLLACAVGGAHLLGTAGPGESLDERLASVDKEITRFQQQTATSRAELATARATIEANRTVAEQPDWSILLALLAKTKGDDVMLRSVSVAPFTPPAPPPPAPGKPAPPPPPTELVLDVMGVGQTQLAVSQHVLRLERTGLFSKVTLVDTTREAFLTGNAIAFRLQCVFGEPRQPMTRPQPALSAVDTGGVNR